MGHVQRQAPPAEDRLVQPRAVPRKAVVNLRKKHRRQRRIRPLAGLGADLLIVKPHRNTKPAAPLRGFFDGRKKRIARGLVVEARRGNHVSADAHNLRRLRHIEIELGLHNVGGIHPHKGCDVLRKPVFLHIEARDGPQIHGLLELHALVHIAVIVNRKIRNHGHRAVAFDQILHGVLGLARLGGDARIGNVEEPRVIRRLARGLLADKNSSRNAQGAVKPRVQNRAAVHVGVREGVIRARLANRLNMQARVVGVGKGKGNRIAGLGVLPDDPRKAGAAGPLRHVRAGCKLPGRRQRHHAKARKSQRSADFRRAMIGRHRAV